MPDARRLLIIPPLVSMNIIIALRFKSAAPFLFLKTKLTSLSDHLL